MKPVKIIRRNFGWFRRKHGILLDPLPPLYQKFLKDNTYLREVSNDLQAMQVVFHVLNMEQQNKRHRKFWYNPYLDQITKLDDVVKQAKKIRWKCAICNTKIMADIESTKPDNFCCSKCKDDYCKPKQKVDQKIIDSSIRFNNHCKKLLKAEQKDFMKYSKRNTLLKV